MGRFAVVSRCGGHHLGSGAASQYQGQGEDLESVCQAASRELAKVDLVYVCLLFGQGACIL